MSNTVGQPLLDAVLQKFLRFAYGWADTEKSYDPRSNSLLDALQAQTLCPREVIVEIESRPFLEWREISVHLRRNGVSELRRLILENATAQNWETVWTGRNQSEQKASATP
jgi:hypothetical protein